MKKRLIALMVAGIMTTATLTGCANGSEKPKGTVKDEFIGCKNKDVYVIIKQNDSNLLHKGDYYRDMDGNSNGFVFECGEDFWSNAEYSTYFEEPKAERYDEKCEDCFSK